VDRFQRHLDAALARLGVDRRAPILVACSGGVDSSALAHAAMQIRCAGRLGAVTLCYVDHRLREGSADDGRVVERLAERGGADFVAVAVDVDRRRASLEEAARDARYAALERVASTRGAEVVLVGHTADDQSETVLMRIIAGTGLSGLAGIPARRGRFVRPLLDLGRADTAGYCGRHRIDVAEDPTNRDPRHRRNRVRHEILPLLRGENPAVSRALVELAKRASEAADLIDAAAAELARAARAGHGWDVAALAAAPRTAAAVVLARGAEGAGIGPLSARHHAALDALLRRPVGGSARVDLPGGCAVREYGRMYFAGMSAAARENRQQAAGDGQLATVDAGPLEVAGPGGPYEIRLVRPGDRMQPVRLRGRSCKLSDLFIDARVPRRLRADARVVVRAADGRIEWAEHIGPAYGTLASVTLTVTAGVATNKSR